MTLFTQILYGRILSIGGYSIIGYSVRRRCSYFGLTREATQTARTNVWAKLVELGHDMKPAALIACAVSVQSCS